MNSRRSITLLLLSGAILVGSSSRAAAYPLLQLDIKNGRYNENTDTVSATSKSFTLYAYLTPPPNTSYENLLVLLSKTYYVSAALTPKVTPGRLGSFSFNNQTIRPTRDMVHGSPPADRFLGGNGHHASDLAKNDIYGTYFKEFSFKFNASNRTNAYDVTQQTGQGPTPVPKHQGNMYFMAFTVDTSRLDPRHKIHFDMYDEVTRHGGNIDLHHHAPVGHHAESFAVPEPGSLILLGSGLAALAARKRRRRGSSPPR